MSACVCCRYCVRISAFSLSPVSLRVAQSCVRRGRYRWSLIWISRIRWASVRLAQRIVHLAPPRSDGITDIRSQNLSAILPDKSRLVYVSTTGVYGDCAGAKFDETRAINPQNARAVRRVAAEQCLRRWANAASPP
jgi:hypothetical protein